MKKLDRFILKAFIGPFAAILLVVIFILMMQFLWLYIDELVGKGLGLRVILEFLMYGICTILPMAVPLATLLASMWVVGQMSENKELLAVKASGVSFARVMAPLTVASILIAAGAWYAGENLVTRGYEKIYMLREDILRTKSEIKIPSGTFYDGIEGYILRVDDQDKETGMLYGVMVYDHTDGKANTSLSLADSATIKLSKAKDYLVFTMFNGSTSNESNTLSYRDTSLTLQRINFKKQELIIPLDNYSFQKSDSSRFGDQIKSMHLKPLKEMSDSLHRELAKDHDAHYREFSELKIFRAWKQLDTTYSTGATQPFEFEGAGVWNTAKEASYAYDQMGLQTDKLIGMAQGFSQKSYSHNYYIRRADVEIRKRGAQALACLILFFIGAPVGCLIRKGGLGTSAIISALFFVLYWVVDISGTKLAHDGAVKASTGAFISAYVLIPIGIFLTWKAVNDSDLFNMDQLKNWWKKITSKVAHLFKPVRIVYMGTPEFAVAPLDKLVKAGYEIAGVVTVADKPSGRGLKVNESAVKQYAVEHGIPVLQPLKLKDPGFLEELRGLKADLFVVVAFRMLPEEVWAMPRLGTFNLHAALLPQYRGAAPINWAVINGERLTGVTTFMLDKDIDTGGIIFREECRIGPDETVGEVHDKLMSIGSDLVLQTVEAIIQKNVEVRVQRSFIQGSEVLKPAPKLTRELCHIDWNDSTDNIYNLIRGLSPYPAAFTEIIPSEAGDTEAKALQLKIFKAAKSELSGTPGSILTDGKSYLAVATRDGAISILDMQLAGKKRMDVKSFLLGFRNPGSYICTQGSSTAEIAKTVSKA